MLFSQQLLSGLLSNYCDHLLLTDAVHGRLNVNVALNRPTFMISTWNDPVYGGEFSSSRAVDGNTDPVALKVDNSCVHSHSYTYPWWAVDLAAAVAVFAVRFTNRADNMGNVSTLSSSIGANTCFTRIHLSIRLYRPILYLLNRLTVDLDLLLMSRSWSWFVGV